jgi:hypothetical protein
MTASAQPSAQPGLQPTVVLVHGAFADASSWNGVIERLQRQGYIAVAPANPLRGMGEDSAYLAACSTRPMVPCCWSATPTAARSSPTLPAMPSTWSAAGSPQAFAEAVVEVDGY